MDTPTAPPALDDPFNVGDPAIIAYLKKKGWGVDIDTGNAIHIFQPSKLVDDLVPDQKVMDPATAPVVERVISPEDLCIWCNKYKIEDTVYRECGPCAKFRKSLALTTPNSVLTRSCTQCKQEFPWDGLEFKTCCVPCFKGKAKKCELCKSFISLRAPKYAKKCMDCFLKERSKTHGVCPLCTGDR